MFGSLRSLFGSWSNSAPRGGLITGASSTPSAQMPLSRKPKLQSLWEAAKATLLDEQPSQQRIAALQDALAHIPLEELALEPECPRPGDPNAVVRSPVLENSGITYLHIHEDATLSLGIFLLPAGTRIPLHNHPGMTVLSRVLYGQLHVTSYDWRDHASDSDPGTPRAAVPVLDVVQGSNDVPVVLFPTFGGNIHQFDAVTDCAVLDLLSPPYSTDDGRDCTYYRVTTTTGNGQEKVAWLQEYDPPRSFAINSGEYRGEMPQLAAA